MTALAPVDAAKVEMAREICALVAEVILAERERCAQIAEGVARDASRDREIFIMTGAAGLGRTIAASIRNPHLPSGAAACAADSPAVGSNSSPSLPSGTNPAGVA